MLVRTISLAVLFAGFASPTVAADANAGRELVVRACSSCHAIDTSVSVSANDAAPPLPSIAKANRQRPDWIRGWLMDPHPPMPNITLSQAQIDNIIAYLNTLPAE